MQARITSGALRRPVSPVAVYIGTNSKHFEKPSVTSGPFDFVTVVCLNDSTDHEDEGIRWREQLSCQLDRKVSWLILSMRLVGSKVSGWRSQSEEQLGLLECLRLPRNVSPPIEIRAEIDEPWVFLQTLGHVRPRGGIGLARIA